MDEFVDTRSRNAVIKRMIELGLIAERSEILPSKRKKSSGKSQAAQRSDDESGSDDDGDSDDSDSVDTRKVKVTVKNVRSKATQKAKPVKPEAPRKSAKASLDVANLRRIVGELNDSAKEHLEWIQESLNDAAEDAEDVDDEEDTSDGVPLVPFLQAQKEAFQNEKFMALLRALGIQKPAEGMVKSTRCKFSRTFFSLFHSF